VLGEGGMGTVWLAHNVDLDAPVALKLVRSDLAPAEAADRLKREARVEAQLEHRAIVRVFDCGATEHGDPFIVMEHLEGTSFADALDEKGRISATSAVRILLPVIDGLAAAHAKGIVHRDVKPENIFLARGPRYMQPKVVDFGIAKLDRWDPNPSLTLKGAVLGSPSYMSPEQARGLGDVDHRADIWAVCAVLYEAITGSPPFRGETYNSILRSIVEDEIAPLSNAGGADAALWVILEQGFAKDRAARFQSMRALGQSLARFLLLHGVAEDVCGDSLVTTWDLDGERVQSLPASHPARSAAPREPLASQSPPVGSAASPSVAPTSTSGLVTPSRLFRESRHHPLTMPAVAALALLVGVGSAMWSSDAAVKTTATASTSEERKAMERIDAPRNAEPLITPVPVAPAPHLAGPVLGPAPVASSGGRAAKARPSRHAVPSAHPAGRHGWPTEKAGTPSRPEPDLRAPATDDDTSRALGLKAPYR
jgi:serine/threonine protein kinase